MFISQPFTKLSCYFAALFFIIRYIKQILKLIILVTKPFDALQYHGAKAAKELKYINPTLSILKASSFNNPGEQSTFSDTVYEKNLFWYFTNVI